MLADLIANGPRSRMSLPEAMNALQRGEIKPPPSDNAVAGLTGVMADCGLPPARSVDRGMLRQEIATRRCMATRNQQLMRLSKAEQMLDSFEE
jgi:hypothetical protein